MNRMAEQLRYWSSPAARGRIVTALDRAAFFVPAVLTIMAVATFAFRFVDHAYASRLVNRYAAALADTDSHKPAQDSAQAQGLDARMQRINQRNLFSNPPAAPPLTGILGDEAYFGGQPLKAGGSVMNVKIVRVNADSVDVEIDGRPTTLYVFGPPSPGGGGPMPGPGMFPGGPMPARVRVMRRGGARPAPPGQ